MAAAPAAAAAAAARAAGRAAAHAGREEATREAAREAARCGAVTGAARRANLAVVVAPPPWRCPLAAPLAAGAAARARGLCTAAGPQRGPQAGPSAGGKNGQGKSQDQGAGGPSEGQERQEPHEDGSDRRFEESGEYDTQEKYKRVGNPIAWANPTGGGTVQDKSSKHWRWVYPAGVVFIVLLCLWSRRKNMRKEREERVIEAPDIRMPDTRGFATRPYVPPPMEADDAGGEGHGEGRGEGRWPELGGAAGSGGFSPPPASRW